MQGVVKTMTVVCDGITSSLMKLHAEKLVSLGAHNNWTHLKFATDICRKMDTVKSVTDMCDGKSCLRLGGTYQTSHCGVMGAYRRPQCRGRWIETTQ